MDFNDRGQWGSRLADDKPKWFNTWFICWFLAFRDYGDKYTSTKEEIKERLCLFVLNSRGISLTCPRRA